MLVGVSSRQLRLRLPRERASVARARAALDGLPLAARRDDARLIVSELVTNAVEHGGGDEIELRLTLEHERLRGEVVDAGGGFRPAPPTVDPTLGRGRGLGIVSMLTDRWGVHAGSTHVWFELRLAAEPAA